MSGKLAARYTSNMHRLTGNFPQCFAKIIALIDHLSPDTTATLSGPSLIFAPLKAMESSEASSS